MGSAPEGEFTSPGAQQRAKGRAEGIWLKPVAAAVPGHGQRCGQRGQGQPAGHGARASSAELGAGGKGRGGCPSHCESHSGPGNRARGEGAAAPPRSDSQSLPVPQHSALGTAWHCWHGPPGHYMAPLTAATTSRLPSAPLRGHRQQPLIMPTAGPGGTADPRWARGQQPQQLQSPVPAVARCQGQVELLPHPRPAANLGQVEQPWPCLGLSWGTVGKGRSGSVAGRCHTVTGRGGSSVGSARCPACSPWHGARSDSSVGAPCQAKGSPPEWHLGAPLGTTAQGVPCWVRLGLKHPWARCPSLTPMPGWAGWAQCHPECPGLPPPAHPKVPSVTRGPGSRAGEGHRPPAARWAAASSQPCASAGHAAGAEGSTWPRRLLGGRGGVGERQESRPESQLPLPAP